MLLNGILVSSVSSHVANIKLHLHAHSYMHTVFDISGMHTRYLWICYCPQVISCSTRKQAIHCVCAGIILRSSRCCSVTRAPCWLTCAVTTTTAAMYATRRASCTWPCPALSRLVRDRMTSLQCMCTMIGLWLMAAAGYHAGLLLCSEWFISSISWPLIRKGKKSPSKVKFPKTILLIAEVG